MRINVPEMNCGHCKATIEKAIGALSPAAQVTCDLQSRTVEILGTVTAEQVIAALDDVGFDATIAA